MTPVDAKFSFPYAGAQWYCIYDYGNKKGFYQKYGVDPTFGGLSGSATIANEVAAGHVDIGMSVGVTTIIPAIQKDAKIKMVATQERSSENAIISLSDNPINTPEDLVGKTIGYGASTSFSISFPLLLAANGIDESDVDIHNVKPTAYASALQNGSIDGYASFPSSSVPSQKSAGGDPVTMLFSDYGLPLSPSNGYIAGDDLIQNNPELITSFLSGARDSWLYVFNHQDELTDVGEYCATQHTGIDPARVKAQLEIVLDLNAAQLEGDDVMKIDKDGMADQAEQLVKAGTITSAGDVADYFTNDLLPDAS